MNWTKTKDKKPEHNHQVMCKLKSGVEVRCSLRYGNMWDDYKTLGYNLYDVEMWRDLNKSERVKER